MGRLPRRHAKDVGQMVAAGPRQLLGEDTLRYRVARRLGRPLLQFLRRLRASQHNEPTKATAQFAGAPLADGDSEVFPINYSPKTSIRFINLASYEVSTRT